VVGGGTVVNGMFFARGSAGDYDAWESLGNPGWGWEGLLPYFKKVSSLQPSEKLISLPVIAFLECYRLISTCTHQAVRLCTAEIDGRSASLSTVV
jgi:hypothetical protein